MFFCFFGSCRFTNEQQNVEFGTNENLSLQWPVFANQLPNKHVQKNYCAQKQANAHMCKQMCAFVHQSCVLQEFWHSFHQKNLNCMQMHTNVCNCLQLHAIAHHQRIVHNWVECQARTLLMMFTQKDWPMENPLQQAITPYEKQFLVFVLDLLKF